MNPCSLLQLQITPIPPLQDPILLLNLSHSLALNSSLVTVMQVPPERLQPQLCMQGMMLCFYQTLQPSTQTCHMAKNCQYIFSAVLRILKFLKNFRNSFVNRQVLQALLLLSVLSLCFSFKLGFIFSLRAFLSLLLESQLGLTPFPSCCPITYLQTKLQQRLLEHPEFGCYCNRIYPPRGKLDLYVADFTPSIPFWHCPHTFNIHALHSYPGSCRVYKS